MPDKITLHWTGGTYDPNTVDRAAYHFLITGTGEVIEGDRDPSDNDDVSDGVYAAHAGEFNTGNIGVAICAMFGANERPFRKGRYPVLHSQVVEAAELCAGLRLMYQIDRDAVYLHSEILPRFRRGKRKWDVNYMPTLADAVVPAEDAGKYFRELVETRYAASMARAQTSAIATGTGQAYRVALAAITEAFRAAGVPEPEIAAALRLELDGPVL